MNDPYPGNEFLKSLDMLVERFGKEHVRYHPPNGDVFIDMPLEKGGFFHAGLSWQQAKYLAFNPTITGDDLAVMNVPQDWPR